MLTATSPCSPACSRATRIISPCALCNAPIVGTSTRRFRGRCACASAMLVRIFTLPALPNCVRCANHQLIRSTNSKSEEKDEHAGDHQCHNPDQIDVKPGAPQNADSKLFINQNREERGHQKVSQCVNCN